MRKILLCEPNISEGRDLPKVEAIVEAVRAVPDVRVVETSSDPDHNRSVLSYIGEPEPVLDATLKMAEKAFETIDMREHRGEHPRFGAVDVVPFIPIRNMSTEEAVAIARRFGRAIGERGVPVYYYEDAATRPERKSLPKIRKGEYEGLRDKLEDPEWEPDEGPATFNPRLGALVTGARFPLIAFNVNLRSQDLDLAQRIARAVRHISGGYRYVRALGFELEDRGMVQVSMNMTRYTKTPLPRVLETIRQEAARHGVPVAGTEIVGPIPLGALEEIVHFYLQAHEFDLNQIIELALIEE